MSDLLPVLGNAFHVPPNTALHRGLWPVTYPNQAHCNTPINSLRGQLSTQTSVLPRPMSTWTSVLIRTKGPQTNVPWTNDIRTPG